jgi:hypothetical protein
MHLLEIHSLTSIGGISNAGLWIFELLPRFHSFFVLLLRVTLTPTAEELSTTDARGQEILPH